ncbi:DUF4238 domain-containing protein [Sphingomonas sp. S-NIH.Pt15_0812]|uniref:DUF4238 domain-containing protein n=1 Tax=Sphingomonas sp. S-NIH.Pt15_0812 TaxID=1920129 RepID=UPI000F7E2122|nr:DUF4238 domain-containing protein [Sphingomonas sp. S-NIH.Pt15_0812]RSU45580.1 hypothetical protein BRX43_18400 [Sphingomonas sp. S-NIH.Pt15_0812]
MGDAKLHHFVPQFYLNRFSSGKGKIWAWEKSTNRSFPTKSNSIAAETYFYRLSQYEKDGHDWSAMEKQFSHIEGEVNLITADWINWLADLTPMSEIPIPEINREIVSRYLSLQYLRTADTREILRALPNADGSKEISEEALRIAHTELLWNLDIVNDLAKKFHDSNWIFARNLSSIEFKTSDNPIAFRTNDNRQWRRLPGNFEDVYASFPLTPSLIMYFYPRSLAWGDRLDFMSNKISPVLFDEDMVHSENSGQVFMATRFMFAKVNDFSFEADFASSIGTDCYKNLEGAVLECPPAQD